MGPESLAFALIQVTKAFSLQRLRRMLHPRRMISILILWCLTCAPLVSWAVPAEGQKIAVSGPSPHAVDAALAIYEIGGNAVDAAVAAALVLAVTSPYYAALGGGGFAILSVGDQTRAIDFREVAPKVTHEEYFVSLPREDSRFGGKAVGIAGGSRREK